MKVVSAFSICWYTLVVQLILLESGLLQFFWSSERHKEALFISLVMDGFVCHANGWLTSVSSGITEDYFNP